MSKKIPGVLYLNVEPQRPLMAVLGHDLTHHLRRANEATYQQLNARLATVLRDQQTYRQHLARSYAAQGLNLPKNWDEELHADIVGDVFTDPQFWQDLAQDRPGLFRRVVNATVKFLDDTLARMTGSRPFGTEKFITDYTRALGLP